MAEAVFQGRETTSVSDRFTVASSALLTGISGLVFVLLVIIENVFFLRAAPLADASSDEISTFYAGNETQVAIALALVALNIPILLSFAAGFVARLARAADGVMPVSGRVGYAGAIGMAAVFAAVSATHAVLVANADALGSEPVLTQMIWDLHSALFAFNSVVLGTALAAFAWAGREMRLTPGWFGYVGLAGGAALIFSGAMVVPGMDGSPLALVGLFGFLFWLFWLAFASIQLLRGKPGSTE